MTHPHAHRWRALWFCEHIFNEPRVQHCRGSCNRGRWVYVCWDCGEPGYAVAA